MITYIKGMKYQLYEEYTAKTPIIEHEAKTTWIQLKEDGTLILAIGYAWDGSSGPTIDTKTGMQASAEHDAFCKLVRYGLLPDSLEKDIDQRYYDKCIEDKMWKLKAKWRYKALKKVSSYFKPSSRKRVYRAP
jgi:hypothetical protein